MFFLFFFFFQAEDGIRDRNVTGVQTCALPIYDPRSRYTPAAALPEVLRLRRRSLSRSAGRAAARGRRHRRSEEHTSELQSRFDLVCRLLLEKKKNRR